MKAPFSLPNYAVSKEAKRGNSSMSHGPTRIPSKGRCIYCGKDDVKLTDEHFLPLALGGQHVIEKASCHACAVITSKFEQHVARDMWGDARNSYNATSRRRNRRPTHIALHDPDHFSRTVRIPYPEYPAPMIFYKMNRAGLLMGLPDYADLSNRDVMLGLAKTCMKLKLSFYEFIGARLGIPGPKIPPLASLIRPAPA